MQRNRMAAAALLSALIIGSAFTGYVIAKSVSSTGHNVASRIPAANRGSGQTASPSPGTSDASPAVPSAPMLPSASSGPGSGGTSFERSLAQFIARRAGSALAGAAPQNVPLGQVKGLSGQVPAGASIDTPADTIAFHAATVSFTVVAIAPGKPDMTFTIAGLTDPAIIVPRGTRVTVRFVNNDTDEAHGWLITDGKPPFGFGQLAAPAIPGAAAGLIGNPTSAGDGADTISFTASGPGSYYYICPMPGHAQMGMHGAFIIR